MAVAAVGAACKVFPRQIFSSTLVNVRHVKRWVKPTLMALRKRQKQFLRETDPKKLLEYTRRSTYIDWNRDAEIYAFGKRLQEDFRLDLLDVAFTHKSYYDKERDKLREFQVQAIENEMGHNKYLVNIGEKVISDHVWNYFSHFYPRFPFEGIKSIHDHLTSTEVLSHISKHLGTAEIILSADYPPEDETHANTMKAIVGALMESEGINKTNIFVRDLIVTQFSGKDINDFLQIDDCFSALSDILKRDNLEEPEPRIICQTAVNTILANYHVGIYSSKKLIGHGSGESIDVAIQMAALDALKRLFHTTDSAKPLPYDAVLSYEGKIYKNLPISEWSESKFRN